MLFELLGSGCLMPSLFANRETRWRRGREFCFVAFLHFYRCWSKHCFMAGFTKKCGFCWCFWCRFRVICDQRPCKGMLNCPDTGDKLLNPLFPFSFIFLCKLLVIINCQKLGDKLFNPLFLVLDVLGLEEDPWSAYIGPICYREGEKF